MEIRDAGPGDWDAIWPFFHQIVAASETYAYDPAMSESEGRRTWMVSPPGRTSVATLDDATVIGTVPQAFRHPVHGFVGLHVMHRFL